MADSVVVTAVGFSALAGYGVGSGAAVLVGQSQYKMAAGAAGAAVAGYCQYNGKIDANTNMALTTLGGASYGYQYPVRMLGQMGSAAAGAIAGYVLPMAIIKYEIQHNV